MPRPSPDMQTAPESPAKKLSRAAVPAATNEQGRSMSTTHSTRDPAPMGGETTSNLPPTAGEIIRGLRLVHDRAVDLLRRADPVAVELHELGYRAGLEAGERQAAARAARDAAAFLAYLAEDPDTTPRPIPSLDHATGAGA